jgi:hypothetical protein
LAGIHPKPILCFSNLISDDDWEKKRWAKENPLREDAAGSLAGITTGAGAGRYFSTAA